MRIIAVLLVLLSFILLQGGCITTKEKEVVKPSSKMTLKECLDQGNPPWICDQIISGTVPPPENLFGTIPENVPPIDEDEIPSSTTSKKSEYYPKDNRVFNTIYDRS
jgi:hypothetical protein